MAWAKIDFERKVAIVSNDVAESEKTRPLLLNNEVIELIKQQKG